jgi:hypothetical protein
VRNFLDAILPLSGTGVHADLSRRSFEGARLQPCRKSLKTIQGAAEQFAEKVSFRIRVCLQAYRKSLKMRPALKPRPFKAPVVWCPRFPPVLWAVTWGSRRCGLTQVSVKNRREPGHLARHESLLAAPLL